MAPILRKVTLWRRSGTQMLPHVAQAYNRGNRRSNLFYSEESRKAALRKKVFEWGLEG